MNLVKNSDALKLCVPTQKSGRRLTNKKIHLYWERDERLKQGKKSEAWREKNHVEDSNPWLQTKDPEQNTILSLSLLLPPFNLFLCYYKSLAQSFDFSV